jgi:hypothetical protein
MPLKAPPYVAPVPTWTGWHIGANGGGTWNSLNTGATDIGPDGFFAVANQAAVTGGRDPINQHVRWIGRRTVRLPVSSGSSDFWRGSWI